MKAIAWDDHRKDDKSDYMSRLAMELGRQGIEMSVERETEIFEKRIASEHFDFFVCDWLNTGGRDTAPPEEESPGGNLLVNVIRRYNKASPIFIVSRHMGRVDGLLVSGFRPIFLKSKDVNVKWMALDIRENLLDFGVMVDSRKVFLIYGHDRKAEGTVGELESWLHRRGIIPARFDARRSSQGILPDLMREMNTCAAFIAVCTPDDYCEEGLHRGSNWWQPRQNVLFEMGIVFGLHRGAHRLTILQKWVNQTPDACARLPSDWGGYVTIRFPAGISHHLGDLEDRLRTLGVELSGA